MPIAIPCRLIYDAAMKRVLLSLLVLFGLLLLAGLACGSIGTLADALRFPRPGELVSVGGTRLHVHCTGEGSPTVILEALSGGSSINWGWVQPEVAAHTRVCAYDRAGRAWSDGGTPSRDLWGTVEDLHTLLRNAGESGPYVMVGHSIGGVYVRGYTERYPDEVAGVVLIDSAHPEQLERYPELRAELENYRRISAIFPILSALGVMRAGFAAGFQGDFGELAEQQRAEMTAQWSSADYWRSQRSELAQLPIIYEQGQELGTLGDLPLTVVTAGTGDADWQTLQSELAMLSTNSRQISVDGATHASLTFNPDHAQQTAEAILAVVDAVRQ